MKKKDLIITQNSFYFVHKHFLKIFNKLNVDIIFVSETGRGKLKKYLEIIRCFGLLNVLIIFFGEVYYSFCLKRKLKKFQINYVDDLNLNILIKEKLELGIYKRVFSVGCPCLINHSFQKTYSTPIYNLHGGIIPFQVGRYSPIESMKKGHKYLGSTLHLINNKFDDGDIISQDYFALKNKRFLNNYNKVLELSAQLIDKFCQNKITYLSKNIDSYFKNF